MTPETAALLRQKAQEANSRAEASLNFGEDEATAEFVAQAITDVPDLASALIDALDDADSLRAEVERLRDALAGLEAEQSQSLTERHMEHWRRCDCLGDLAVCCVATCECQQEVG